jgi:rhodanese-related sulfurtransferase
MVNNLRAALALDSSPSKLYSCLAKPRCSMFSMFRSPALQTRLSMPEIAAKLATGQMQLIDVREIAEVRASGKAEGAIVIPLSLLPLKADPKQPGNQLKPGVPVAVYCASGGRSGMAADLLTRLGYGPVTNLGGLRDWAAGGGKVVPY